MCILASSSSSSGAKSAEHSVKSESEATSRFLVSPAMFASEAGTKALLDPSSTICRQTKKYSTSISHGDVPNHLFVLFVCNVTIDGVLKRLSQTQSPQSGTTGSFYLGGKAT